MREKDIALSNGDEQRFYRLFFIKTPADVFYTVGVFNLEDISIF